MPTIHHQACRLIVRTLPPSLYELRRTSRFACLCEFFSPHGEERLRASRTMWPGSRHSSFETALSRLPQDEV